MTQDSASYIQQSNIIQVAPNTVKVEISVEKKQISAASSKMFQQSASRDSSTANYTSEKKELQQTTAPAKRIPAKRNTAPEVTEPFHIINPDTIINNNEIDSTVTVVDSSFVNRDTLETTIPSYFAMKEGDVRKELQHDQWIWGVIFGALIIFASTRLFFNKYLSSVFSSLFNYTASSHLFRERGYSLVHGAFRLDLLFFLTTTTYLFQLFTFLGIQVFGLDGFKLFLLLFGFINGLAITKYFMHRFIAFVAKDNSVLPEIIFTKYLFYKALGIFLLPIIVIHKLDSPYLQNFFVISSIISIIFYLTSLARSLFIGFKKGVSIYYLILYLCTLEFLPMLLIWKLFIKQV